MAVLLDPCIDSFAPALAGMLMMATFVRDKRWVENDNFHTHTHTRTQCILQSALGGKYHVLVYRMHIYACTPQLAVRNISLSAKRYQ
jgi:hypothetical protein